VRLRLVRTDGREVARVTTRPAILSYMGDGCLSEMPVKIERIDPWHVDVPLPAPLSAVVDPRLRPTGNRSTLIRLRTRSGLEGWSAARRTSTEAQVGEQEGSTWPRNPANSRA
jgi:hypothetical protein